MSAISNILSLFYIFRSLQLTAVIWREWQGITQEPLTRHKKQLAEQASFFIAVPIGVFFHEFSHSLATWASGGQVVEFAYRAFWGYIIPSGQFTPFQYWFISLAGTLGSLLFGLTVWLLLRHHRYSALRYFGLRAFRFQVYFSLIYYPVFTLLGFEGDWRMIYDFGATPLWSGVTAVFHIALLFLFWQGDRRGWFEMLAHDSLAYQDAFHALAASVRDTLDTQTQIRYIDALRRGGAVNKAKYQLAQLLRTMPDSGSAHLEMALLLSEGKRQVPLRAIEHTRQALSLGLPNNISAAFAHQLLGKYNLDISHLEEADSHISQAIALTQTEPESDPLQLARLYHLHSQVSRQQRQMQRAHADLQQALSLAQTTANEQAIAYYQGELDVIGQDR
ncbi:MAG: M50 family metallopeptidase [Anaerolineales bacterium]|nr:M50 family metallopeptidase [Anaerolineales bacterium]